MLGFTPFKRHPNKFNYIPRYYDPEKEGGIQESSEGGMFTRAVNEAVSAVESAGNLLTNMKSSLVSGMNLLLEFVCDDTTDQLVRDAETLRSWL